MFSLYYFLIIQNCVCTYSHLKIFKFNFKKLKRKLNQIIWRKGTMGFKQRLTTDKIHTIINVRQAVSRRLRSRRPPDSSEAHPRGAFGTHPAGCPLCRKNLLFGIIRIQWSPEDCLKFLGRWGDEPNAL